MEDFLNLIDRSLQKTVIQPEGKRTNLINITVSLI